MKSLLNPRTGKPIVQRGTVHLSDDELRALISRHGFANADKLLAIAKLESGGWADIIVDTRGMSSDELKEYWGRHADNELSVGLFQLNVLRDIPRSDVLWSPFTDASDRVNPLLDADANADGAFTLSKGGAWLVPWGM